MFDRLKRRDFLRLAAASSAALSGIAHASEAGQSTGNSQQNASPWPPKLDGSLDEDNETLEAAAIDQGEIILRKPRAVLRPRSAQDVVKIVRYAHQNRIPVAVRGRGHSAYGQTLAADGFVIDSSTLANIGRVSGNTIEVDAGASLANVYRTAFEAGCTLPVTTGCTMLAVGGWISVGGLGVESVRHGAFIDHVIELQVVTGDGRLMTCSDSRERELFEMMLGGMGQCGIIVRAKLRVVPAYEQVTLRTIAYDALEPFLDEQRRFAADERLHSLWTAIFKQQGNWTYRTTVGRVGRAGEDTDTLPLIGSISNGRVLEPFQRTFRDIAEATFARPLPPTATKDGGRPRSSLPRRPPAGSTFVSRPTIALYLPASVARDVMTPLLVSERDNAGITTIECVAQNTKSFQRPLFRLPGEEQIFSCWALRSSQADSGASLREQMEANARLLDRALAMGAKRYPPFGGMTTPADWRAHYGENIYQRFAAAKRKYDPRSVLSPEVNVFG